VTISNPIYCEFVELGLIDPAAVEQIAKRTRDADIPVYRDAKSKVIFLERAETSDTYYEAKGPGDRAGSDAFIAVSSGEPVRSTALDDARRRFTQFEPIIRGRVLCDFGAGYGEFLDHAATAAKQCFGVEPRQLCRDHIAAQGIAADVRKSIGAHDAQFDVVTMFHVLEHIPTQVKALREVAARLKAGGQVIVEVPHAEDFLIQSVDLPEFRAFTFWSEHLVLHTRASLRTVMERAGLRNVTIIPYQRYGFTNHLHWFIERRPGGHEAFAKFENADLEQAYRKAREADGTSDTLIAIGSS
jgi:2-polyprenyl-3-methyl-5-hydroxy-6-metoxy-1,4-benzoquinol methylase